MNGEQSENLNHPSILDTVSQSQQTAALRSFNPQTLINDYVDKLAAREKQIIISRYGLADGIPETLETIGKKMNLTRERVRQIEKEALKKLAELQPPSSFVNGVELLFQVIEENGKAMRVEKIFEAVLPSGQSDVSRMGVLFMLHLVSRFVRFKETSEFHEAWSLGTFDQPVFKRVVDLACEALKTEGQPLPKQELFVRLKNDGNASQEIGNLSSEAIESYLTISKKIDKNPFDEWGLAEWANVHPKDVGDKAFLVLSHHGKPEHYAKITEMINKNRFDERVAQKETVHNELIKDKRFVLVGRGIYALSSWGYKPGVVADIIEQILKDSDQPLSKEEIIERVLKQRLVKKNTIIVGLSNKQRFKKIEGNKYGLADQSQ